MPNKLFCFLFGHAWRRLGEGLSPRWNFLEIWITQDRDSAREELRVDLDYCERCGKVRLVAKGGIGNGAFGVSAIWPEHPEARRWRAEEPHEVP